MPSKLIVVMATGLAAAGCGGFERGAATAENGGDDGATTYSFTNDVHPLLMSKCSACHEAGAPAGSTEYVLTGTPEADYAVVFALIDASAPSSSRLLTKGTGSGHGGGAVIAAGSTDYNTILGWIEGGGLE